MEYPNQPDPLDNARWNFLAAGGKLALLAAIEADRPLTPEQLHQKNEAKKEMVINGAPIAIAAVAEIVEKLTAPPRTPRHIVIYRKGNH